MCKKAAQNATKTQFERNRNSVLWSCAFCMVFIVVFASQCVQHLRSSWTQFCWHDTLRYVLFFIMFHINIAREVLSCFFWVDDFVKWCESGWHLEICIQLCFCKWCVPIRCMLRLHFVNRFCVAFQFQLPIDGWSASSNSKWSWFVLLPRLGLYSVKFNDCY